MKKLVALILVLMFSLCVVGCKKPTATSESVVVDIPLGGSPAGNVDLGEDLTLFNSLLANNYINVIATINDDGNEYDVSLNARRTKKGYDAIITITEKTGSGVWKMYYVDGVEIRGTSFEGEEFGYVKTNNVYFTDLIYELNKQINSNEITRVIYQVLKPIVHKFNGFTNVQHSKDYANFFNGCISLLEQNRDNSLYNFVVGELMGIDVDDEDATAKIKEDILDFCSGNPSVAVFIDRIEAYVNTLVSEENKINVKEYLNNLQQKAEISTQEFVEFLKVNYPAIEQNLRAPSNDETIYDYLRSYLRTMSLNVFTKSVLKADKTFVEYIDELIETSKQIKLEDAIDWLVSMVVLQQRDENGEIIIDKHFDSFVKSEFVVHEASVSLNVEVDSKLRPINLEYSHRLNYGCYDTSIYDEAIVGDTEFSIVATISYKDLGIKFEIPKEVYDAI